MRYKIKENKDQLAFSFKKRSWKTTSFVLGLCLVVAFFSSRASFKVYLNYKDSRNAVSNKQNELITLENREKFLRGELKKLETPEGREAKLREKFGVARPGENLAIIVEAEDSNFSTSTLSLWSKFKNFFTDLFK